MDGAIGRSRSTMCPRSWSLAIPAPSIGGWRAGDGESAGLVLSGQRSQLRFHLGNSHAVQLTNNQSADANARCQSDSRLQTDGSRTLPTRTPFEEGPPFIAVLKSSGMTYLRRRKSLSRSVVSASMIWRRSHSALCAATDKTCAWQVAIVSEFAFWLESEVDEDDQPRRAVARRGHRRPSRRFLSRQRVYCGPINW